jgi:hypothetical protein
MSQNYKIKHLDAGKEPFMDRNGNTWINVLFEEASSEPIKWVVKDMSKFTIGQTVYGRIETPEGKSYKRFYREPQPDTPANNQSSAGNALTSTTSSYDSTQESIARSVALKAAVDLMPGASPPAVLGVAGDFLHWLQQNSNTSKKEKSNVAQSNDKEDDKAVDTYINQAESYEGNPDDIPFD